MGMQRRYDMLKATSTWMTRMTDALPKTVASQLPTELICHKQIWIIILSCAAASFDRR